ncbi:MAG: M20 family metallopeptidase [Phycisphaerales bacterium]|nr:M20 family metallopeptidase [Phycisphaerales bacterium]
MASPLIDDRELLAKLVGLDTTSARSNRDAIDAICDYLDRPGLRLHRLAAGEGKENLVVEAGPDDGTGSGLTLSGHLDCVPTGEGWTTDPFELIERDGALFGRGACDMKGFDALAINALARAASQELSAPLALVLTCDEEIGGVGAACLVDSWPSDHVLPRSTIIGEPTLLKVVRMHKGHLKFYVRIHGSPGHSGNPTAGRNALAAGASAVGVLSGIAKAFQEMRTDTSAYFDDVSHPVLAVVGMESGQAWNIIPDECEIRCGLRVLPDQDAAVVLDDIRDALGSALKGFQWELVVYNDNPPLCTSEEAEVNDLACGAVRQDRSIGVSFCSDGGHLAKLGLECVLWGPGSIEQAHQADEFISLEQLNLGADLLKAAITQQCMRSEKG